MLFLKRNAEAVILVLGLLIALTPVWRWATLPASPTAEEISRLICAAPRDIPAGQRPETIPRAAPQRVEQRTQVP
jgi:hypothetical protein